MEKSWPEAVAHGGRQGRMRTRNASLLRDHKNLWRILCGGDCTRKGGGQTKEITLVFSFVKQKPSNKATAVLEWAISDCDRAVYVYERESDLEVGTDRGAEVEDYPK